MPKGIYKRSPEALASCMRNVKLAHKAWMAKYKPTWYTCEVCGIRFTDKPSTKRRFCSQKCKAKWHFSKPELHPNYQGRNGNTTTIHKWVQKKRGGRPDKCEWCGKNPGRAKDGRTKIHWANLSGEYKRDLSDWAALCMTCHWKHDKPWLKRRRRKDGSFAKRRTKLVRHT